MRPAITPKALDDLDALPAEIAIRVRKVIVRLKAWPHVSGSKPLTGQWKGHYRIRTGDWRVIFRARPDGAVLIVRVMHRKNVYDD